MAPSCLSIVSLVSYFRRRSLTSAGLSSQTVDIDGDTTVHFWGPQAAATSKPKLVLIHGFGPPGIWQWRHQASFFAGKFDVYMPDLIFFGQSFTNSSDRTEIFQATCVAKLLEKLGISRYTVVGTSYGGFVAYRMAEIWPERVEKVVIASSAVNMRRSDNDRLLKKADVANIEDLLLPATVERLRTSLGVILSRRPRLPDFMLNFVLNDFLDKLYSENRKEKLELLTGLTIGQDETVRLTPLSQDVLIVWGQNDQIFLLEKAVELKRLLGENVSVEVIKNGSHVPQLEHAGQFNKIVNDFLHG